MNKFIITLCLLILPTISNAQDIPPLPIIHNSTLENNQIIVNDYNEENIPKELNDWNKWVKKDLAYTDCPTINGVRNCIYINKLNISGSDIIKVSFNGYSYIDNGYVNLVNNESLYPNDILVDNKPAYKIIKNDLSYIKVNKGSFEINYFYKNKELENKNIILTHDILNFKNDSAIKMSKEGNVINFNAKDVVVEAVKNEYQNIKVYRKFRDSIPSELETKIMIDYSGKEKEINLGKIIPEDFKLVDVKSDLNVKEDNGSFKVTLSSGEHEVNIKSYSTHIKENISVVGLITGINKEIWSIQNEPNIRQVKINNSIPVDNIKSLVPNEWSNFPSYKVNSSIVLTTEKRGVEIKSKVDTGENRVSWYGFNGDILKSKSDINVSNKNNLLYKVEKGIKLNSFSINDKNEIIVNSNGDIGVIANEGEFKGSVETEVKNINQVPYKFFNGDVDLRSWELHLAPRTRVLYASGVDYISNSWYYDWNLYLVFLLVVVSFLSYKIFGKLMAAISFISILIFQYYTVFAWFFWIAYLILIGLLKIIPHNNINIRKWLSIILKVLIVYIVLNACLYIIQEVRLIINPSLELLYPNKQLFTLSDLLYSIFWIVLIVVAFKEYMKFKENKISKIRIVISLIVLLMVSSVSYELIGTTSQTIFGNQRNQATSISEEAGNGVVASMAPASIAVPEMKAMESMDMLTSRNMAVKDIAVKKEVYVEDSNETDKYQVGSGLPSWHGNTHNIRVDKYNKENIKLYLFNANYVNAFAVFQILFVLLIVFISILTTPLNVKINIELLPNIIKNNKFFKLMINEINNGVINE